MPDAVADRHLEALRLLVDLLQHEGLEPLALGDLLVPVDPDLLQLDRAAVLGTDDADACRGDLDDLAVPRIGDAAGLGQERREVGGEEVLAVAEPDHERRLAPHADEPVGLAVVDDDEGEVSFETAVDGAHRFEQVAVVDALEQVCDHLGIGLGGEGVAACLELGLQLAVVLDDPVEDDRKLAVLATGERVRVVLADTAVGRPARVADPRRRVRAVRRNRLLQLGQVADRADVLEPGVLEQGDSGRVVAAELEPLQAGDQDVLGGTASDVSDDPAHARRSFLARACRR